MFSTVLALCFLLKIISRSNYFAPILDKIVIKVDVVELHLCNGSSNLNIQWKLSSLKLLY